MLDKLKSELKDYYAKAQFRADLLKKANDPESKLIAELAEESAQYAVRSALYEYNQENTDKQECFSAPMYVIREFVKREEETLLRCD
jgi:hypothetical protein